MQKNCKHCGKEFLTTNKNQIYCTPKCARKECAKKRIEREKEEQEQLKRKKKKQNNLIEINEAARAAGMTYGKYVALHYAKTLSFHGGEDDKSTMHGLP